MSKSEEMQLEGAITTLFSDRGLTIEIRDKNSRQVFVKATLTPEQVCQSLSRLAETPCEMVVSALEKVGKYHHNSQIVFELTEEEYWSKKDEDMLYKKACQLCPQPWVVEKYFGSQQSFFVKDGRHYCRVTVRAWMDSPVSPESPVSGV